MNLKNWKITKSENSEGSTVYSLSLSVKGFDNEDQAEKLLRNFKTAITRAGGQTTFDKEDA